MTIKPDQQRLRIIGDIIECDREPVAKILIGTSTLRDRLEEAIEQSNYDDDLYAAQQDGYDEGYDAGYDAGHNDGLEERDAD